MVRIFEIVFWRFWDLRIPKMEPWDRIKFAFSRRHEQFIFKFVAGVRRAALSAIETKAGRPRRPGSGLVGGPAKGAT
jgi:hypothetical protein